MIKAPEESLERIVVYAVMMYQPSFRNPAVLVGERIYYLLPDLYGNRHENRGHGKNRSTARTTTIALGF